MNNSTFFVEAVPVFRKRSLDLDLGTCDVTKALRIFWGGTFRIGGGLMLD